MKIMRISIPFLLLAVFLFATTAQAVNQHYFRFQIKDRKELQSLENVITIDRCAPWDGQTVYAYATDQQFENFQALGIAHEKLTNPGELIEVRMANTAREARDWNVYPTFSAYKQMMVDFATNYPAICEIDTIGYSEEGRELLAVKISDNVSTEEPEPEVFFTSSMHGDEIAGYVSMLRLIDSLLVSYGSDARITDMVNNMEIFINPSANPDGTYNGGDNTVFGATRYNSNGVDLNRNFPDPDDGDHPDGNSWQDETLAMIAYAEDHNFIISANFHGGAEVVNYPWDTWSRRHPDDAWWITTSRHYATLAQNASPSGYMTDLNNGITNGWDWYPISGGRQDLMNYWYGCREATIELSSVKLVAESQLPNYWIYNREAFLDYLETARYGITGIVTSSESGQPLPAIVSVVDHDPAQDSSVVRCDPDHGNYHRMIEPGTWDLEFSAPGYVNKTITGISVLNGMTVVQDVQLDPVSTDPVLSFVSETAPTRIDPGDNVSMYITLENDGGGPATNVVGVLSTADSYITVTQSSSGYPTISELGGTALSQGQYSFSVAPETPSNYQVDFRLDITADDGYVDTAFFSLMVGLDVEDFETADFSSYNWQNSGAAPWSISSTNKFEGSYAAGSGSITHDQYSQLSVNVEIVEAGDLSFRIKVSSEPNWDFLKFYIDGVIQDSVSGEVGWTEWSYPLTTGNHTLSWKYEKDGSVSGGSDMAWLDLIVFPPLTTPLVITTTSLPDGWVGDPYSQQLEVQGGTGTISWVDLNDDLTGTGLTLSSSGMLSGTPADAGIIQFTARASDEESLQTDKQFNLRVVLCADADGNGAVAISDAVTIISYIFGGGPAPDPLAVADVDCNSGVSISDAVLIIQYIFGGGPVPCGSCE